VKDTNVSPEIQQRFATSYGAAGGKMQLELLPGAPHNFVNVDWSESGSRARLDESIYRAAADKALGDLSHTRRPDFFRNLQG
jgi:dienelactone hydrolase